MSTQARGDQLVHGLRWGIKASFIEYLRRMPGGRASASDGAVPVGTNEIFFAFDPAVRPPAEHGQAAWAFRGDVRFSGHFGLLFVRVAAPWIVLDAGSAVLTIAPPHEREDAPRVPLVTATLERAGRHAGTEAWTSTSVRLTSAGAEIFNDVYPEGEPFAPLTVQVPDRHGLAVAPR
ncbi:HtaA domain-containing protein [Phytohabitans sp. ZYX-F-186]|uniref:HtaA domain-containing protein n=1 Tax=Phytohabitans maris TaxID=3071409 RepID=A0ABU0ZSP6_9ACTN|nr:HtaA domain-containing protein [Phytohabitans sp. ZYX-F-186]MDQ7909339.1 HtaA domain-containing protein [Phytohabitans sp. ZYX-F-186]